MILAISLPACILFEISRRLMQHLPQHLQRLKRGERAQVVIVKTQYVFQGFSSYSQRGLDVGVKWRTIQLFQKSNNFLRLPVIGRKVMYLMVKLFRLLQVESQVVGKLQQELDMEMLAAIGKLVESQQRILNKSKLTGKVVLIFFHNLAKHLAEEYSDRRFFYLKRNIEIGVTALDFRNAMQVCTFLVVNHQIQKRQRLKEGYLPLRPCGSHAIDDIRLEPEFFRVDA